ncbi:hypothetical protein AAFH96_29740, partial [Polymorphospora sp. 2-325]
MRSRGSERPEDGSEEGRDARPKGRRWGRNRPEPAEPEQVSGEELGWIADLRTAREQRADIGPGGAEPTGPRGGAPEPFPGDLPPAARRGEAAPESRSERGEPALDPRSAAGPPPVRRAAPDPDATRTWSIPPGSMPPASTPPARPGEGPAHPDARRAGPAEPRQAMPTDPRRPDPADPRQAVPTDPRQAAPGAPRQADPRQTAPTDPRQAGPAGP